MYSKSPFDDNILTFGKDLKNKMTIGGKYVTKYSDTPPPGKYNIDAAEMHIRKKSPAVVIREPLNLYKKPPSIRPEVNDAYLKPFGADIKTNAVTMGSKYETKYFANPSVRDIDYDALMRATKPKTQSMPWAPPSPSKNGSRLSDYPVPEKFYPTPDVETIKNMSRQEKIRLLQQLNGGAGPEEPLRSPGKLSPGKFSSSAKKRPATGIYSNSKRSNS